MKLTTDIKRINDAHYTLIRLEDEIVGAMFRGDSSMEKIINNRLESIRTEVWKAIKCLNEALDRP
jgi:hypothetical protein